VVHIPVTYRIQWRFGFQKLELLVEILELRHAHVRPPTPVSSTILACLRVALSLPPAFAGVNAAMYKYVVEFIGTFFLVLTIGCTVVRQDGEFSISRYGFCAAAIVKVARLLHGRGSHIGARNWNWNGNGHVCCCLPGLVSATPISKCATSLPTPLVSKNWARSN
jgi:hypothetical protein